MRRLRPHAGQGAPGRTLQPIEQTGSYAFVRHALQCRDRIRTILYTQTVKWSTRNTRVQLTEQRLLKGRNYSEITVKHATFPAVQFTQSIVGGRMSLDLRAATCVTSKLRASILHTFKLLKSRVNASRSACVKVAHVKVALINVVPVKIHCYCLCTVSLHLTHD